MNARLLSLLLLALATPAAAAQDLGRAPAEDGEETRFFALPMVRDTREQAALAEEHLRAARYPEAIAALQRILDEHAHEILPPTSTALGAGATYPGAGEWALARLAELPAAARELYRARYEPRAAEALQRARRSSARAQLAAIPRQFPLTPSAVQAWWALGDLELEGGQPATAELAWQRAAELARVLELTLTPGAERLAWLAARTEAGAPPARVTLPRGDAVPWTQPLDLTPFSARGNPYGGRHNLQPVSTGELVLAGTSLRLYALDAFAGTLRWQAGPPPGWSLLAAQGTDGRLFEGLSEHLFLAPAHGNGIAVAAMQQPFTENESDDWQGIEIMKAIPERRLHAYDLASGRELWNHAPELSFDGRRFHWDGGGSYAQRMMVAGAPIVVGARVLVPCYRMQGRIDYHVACYELASGELLWSTQLISGQRERNMFGRSTSEFCASPLVVSGARVLAQTELGTLAALDLFSGRILWQTTYRQIPLPKTRSYRAPPRPVVWRLAPPAVVGDVLVATPSDSIEVVALRVSDGTKLWAYSEDMLKALDRDTEIHGFNQLVGADQDTLYLSGAKLVALQKPGGLASSAPFVQRWPAKKLARADTSARTLLTPTALLVPSPVERLAFDRRTGELIAEQSGSWNGGEAGGVWLDEGALFSLSLQGISGYFDWRAQLERARRLAQGSGEEAPLRNAAELFLRRGTLSLAERDLEAAQAALEEARGFYARLRAERVRPDTSGELACARALAETLARLRREEEALAVLSAARALAVGRADQAGLLFLEERLRRVRGGAPRLSVLAELEECWGDFPLPDETQAEAVGAWLVEGGAGDAPEGAADPVPTRLWVELERASERVRANELASALTDLHAALPRARGLDLARGLPLSDLVRARIARVLALPGGRAAYAAIEERALAQLAEARAGADDGLLAAVGERFPHSQAAEQALALRLERALATGDAPAVAELVRLSLARGGLGAEREDALLLQLARVLGQQGNGAFERALLLSLARRSPQAVSELPEHGGKTFATLAAELGAEGAPQQVPAPVRFDAKVVSLGKPRGGAHEYLGSLLPTRQAAEGAPSELHLYATREELLAFSSLAPGQPLWRKPLPQPLDGGPEVCSFAEGRLVFATRAGLTCLDEHGEVSWTRALDGDAPRALRARAGVLVALTRHTALAFDALLGLPLWTRNLGAGGNWSGPVLGDGHALFFSQVHAVPPRALALDLFHGRVSADIRLTGFDSRSSLASTAWIAGERLIAPSFQVRPGQLGAFSLLDGRRAWTIEFGRDEEFFALARSEGRTFAVTLATSLGTSAGNGGVYEVEESTGTLRRIVPLRPGERIMGLEGQSAAELAAPYLFTTTSSEGERGVPIRALHLPYGVQWTWSLPIASQEVYDGRNLPMPAVSADCVAIAYQTRRANGNSNEATIVFVDKRAGKKVDTLTLGGLFARTSRLELRGLGTGLFVLARGPTMPGMGLEILESMR